jgi:hypothetical protein
MLSLQKLIYQQLPQSVKEEIYNNPDIHPEYNQVITELNKDVLKTFKEKIKLSNKNIRFLKTILEIYYHIKLFHPRGKDKFKSSIAWNDFIIKNNYTMYDEYIDEVDKWPKFMFLLYDTYIFAYNEYYKIKQSSLAVDDLPKYNRKTNDFFQYIIKLYMFIDKNSTLEELRDWGY